MADGTAGPAAGTAGVSGVLLAAASCALCFMSSTTCLPFFTSARIFELLISMSSLLMSRQGRLGVDLIPAEIPANTGEGQDGGREQGKKVSHASFSKKGKGVGYRE